MLSYRGGKATLSVCGTVLWAGSRVTDKEQAS